MPQSQKVTLKLELEFEITDQEQQDYVNLTQVNSEDKPWLFEDLKAMFHESISITLTDVKKID